MRTEKNGNSYDFKLDVPAIMDMEAKDPKFSILNIMSDFADCPRFTDLNILAKSIGWDYTEFIAAGFNIKDLLEIVSECMKEIGFFIDSEPEPAQPEQAA